eukprot:TRINITY_DN15541_c0_g1_i6.p1 TRINITY_DN15541_c0_g1~~TRINITY_DN15541_c0_g1_i6.p1  ORF type:complete len:170 (+),score=11.52 TRINITY_DN15541_c0_g1_i6:78-587(+)
MGPRSQTLVITKDEKKNMKSPIKPKKVGVWSDVASGLKLKPEQRAARKFMLLLEKAQEKKAKAELKQKDDVDKLTKAASPPPGAPKTDAITSFLTASGVQDLVTRLADSGTTRKGGRGHAAKKEAMLEMLKTAMAQHIGPTCKKCSCKDFVPNAFNREKCNICFHNHQG